MLSIKTQLKAVDKLIQQDTYMIEYLTEMVELNGSDTIKRISRTRQHLGMLNHMKNSLLRA